MNIKKASHISIFLLNVLLLINQLYSKQPAVEIKSFREAFPVLFKRLQQDMGRTNFELGLMSPQRDKIAICLRTQIKIFDIAGIEVARFNLNLNGIDRPAPTHFFEINQGIDLKSINWLNYETIVFN
ncbi:hypothetical protein JW964_00660 [candidate division KSB1 bacterium]|nr:hypothetical protein [candidate division KSB1 bacterium]